MVSICGEGKQEYNTLDFGETLMSYKINKWNILEMQVYYDENNREVYNISIESNDKIGLISNTVDYFETRGVNEAKAVYETIKNMFKQVKEADKNARK